MGSVPDMDINQTLSIVKSSISSEIHNKNKSKFNAQIWQTTMDVRIVEINSQGRIWTVATRVTDILFVLVFLSNF